MNDFCLPTWNEIYRHWRFSVNHGPRILNKKFEPEKIYIKSDVRFYGYDWFDVDEVDQRKKLMTKDFKMYEKSYKPTNKGTIHTLEMLLEANDEEKAAIWLYAFAKEFSDMQGVIPIKVLAMQICEVASDFLQDKFVLWHCLMKKLTPEIFISPNLFLYTEFPSIEAVIDLAVLNTAMVLHEYVPVMYTSLNPEENVKFHTVRK